MHLPYPARKDSNAARYKPARPPSASSGYIPPILRRIRLRGGLIIAVVTFACFYLFSSISRASTASRSIKRSGAQHPITTHAPTGNPPAVLVTVMDSGLHSNSYLQNLKENRLTYARKHGYETWFPDVFEYDLKGAPTSWSKVVAMRHALTKFPDATYFWFLDHDTIIVNMEPTVEQSLMEAKAIGDVMIKDHPVVPPDSIIKTFTHLKGEDVDLVLTQDKAGLSVGSFIVRNGEWAKFFLETWFDPIYRSYNFQKAEEHALEHIVQWHPTILSKLAIVPQRYINSYNTGDSGESYQAGDMVVRFPACSKVGYPACEAEAAKYEKQWRGTKS
ncbi:putative alpha-1,6-mannosyltransferase mnn11 [Pyricularia oryzae]